MDIFRKDYIAFCNRPSEMGMFCLTSLDHGINVTPLPLFIEFHFHRTLWIVVTKSISILKVSFWNNSTESVQWNFDVKVYELTPSFMFPFIYITINLYNCVYPSYSSVTNWLINPEHCYLFIKMAQSKIAAAKLVPP